MQILYVCYAFYVFYVLRMGVVMIFFGQWHLKYLLDGGLTACSLTELQDTQIATALRDPAEEKTENPS